MYYPVFIFCFCSCLFVSTFEANNELAEETGRWAQRCAADELEPWSYRGDNGPMYWGEIYPQCHGFRQSPIFIDTGRVDTTRFAGSRFFNYRLLVEHAFIRNNGYTVQVIVEGNIFRGISTFDNRYYLSEIHFHWGSTDDVGSEHVVDGVQYPMEMQLVHKNGPNSTVVVAVLFEVVDGINAELQHIVNELPRVMYKDNEARLRYRFDLWNLMPTNPVCYYEYEGSMTTPDCTEGIVWLIVKDVNYIGRSQLQEFRKLFSAPQNRSENACRISNNFRPVQHLHRRQLLRSRCAYRIITGDVQ